MRSKSLVFEGILELYIPPFPGYWAGKSMKHQFQEVASLHCAVIVCDHLNCTLRDGGWVDDHNVCEHRGILI
ncbi:hypothetical protein TNIN_378601 [Trichonephila inaurata madagascariensis]|uniref:Uncharacterized protein n=1 Tax=Trichonephila inaurata madagascariensis TaxID=2747483 RepID=A0A8X6YCB9_9ARAC|nr:hypothetical protein TNIN_378601 [Trichonephila inaurata madagascariensis]